MAIITVNPDQNIFYHNYHGSSVYMRGSQYIIRRKYTPHKISSHLFPVSSHLLGVSSICYTQFSPDQKNTFIDYASSHPKYKSGIAVSNQGNINKNIPFNGVFKVVNSISPDPYFPETPVISVLSRDFVHKIFEFSWTNIWSEPVTLMIYGRPYYSINPPPCNTFNFYYYYPYTDENFGFPLLQFLNWNYFHICIRVRAEYPFYSDFSNVLTEDLSIWR